MMRVVRRAAFALAVVAVAAPPASAATTACSTGTTSPLFGAWGDPGLYSPFKGASFESGASGWSWIGKANIVAGDDDHLLAATGSHAVDVPPLGGAKSPWTCVDSTMPSMRFFLRRVSGTGALTVKGTLAGGGMQLTTLATVYGSGTWQPSPVVAFPPSMMSALAAGGLNAQFTFSADSGSEYRIDDVEIDPFKSL